MAFTKLRSRLRVTASWVGLLVSISACGSDSSGPNTTLEPSAALQSLVLGMGAAGAVSGTIPDLTGASLDAIAQLLDQVDITIDGKSQSMYGLAFRETFPAGTCLEDVFIFPSIPPENGICTEPELGLGIVLWQSHSAFEPPDRMIVIASDVGTIDFDFSSSIIYGPGTTPISMPGVAMYLEGGDNFWFSLSGTLTSQVAATSQPCGLPLPPYAKSGSCSVATFDEQGAITFELFTDTGPSTRHLNMTIPRQTLNGLWLTITETQPITFPDFQRNSRWLGR